MKNQLITPCKISIKMSEIYGIFLDERTRQYPFLQLTLLRTDINKERLSMLGCYSIKIIMKLIEISNANAHFLPILGINYKIIYHNYMCISGLLTPLPIISARELIKIIKSSQHQQISQQSLQLLQYFRSKIHYYWLHYYQQLTQLSQDCYDFYLINHNKSFDVVIGITNFLISKEKKQNFDLIQQIEVILLQKSNENSRNVQELCVSIFSIQTIKSNKLKTIQSDNQYYYILDAFLTRYANNVCDFIEQSLKNQITNYIYQHKKMKNYSFNIQSLSMIDRQTHQPYQGEIYHNINCTHFQGNSLTTFQQTNQCPICGNKLIFDRENLENYCQNLFQMLLLSNFMNNNKNDVTFYFKENVFTLKMKEEKYYRQKFSNYFHFKLYVQRCKNLMQRNQIMLINNYETISLHNKMNKPAKYYGADELIDCPVRGRYCRHWQFYDLRRVYRELLTSQDGYFECFVCCRDVHCEQLLYLRQMKEIIDVAKQFISESYSTIKALSASLKLYHQKQQCELILNSPQKNLDILKLDIYSTMKRPLLKSRCNDELYQSKKINLPTSFVEYFYGI